MCGICGFVTKENIALQQLNDMNDTMYHRGPDDHGAEIYNLDADYSIGMAQRRLSILDLSPLGHQPMHSGNGRITVVYNGEIYNFRELREQLGQYEFISTCDTEVIIAAYLEWGIDCIRKFNGMFAIAIFDRETGEVFLVRDRIGKKPLYYWYQDQNLVFASELKPIMAYPGFQKTICTEVLGRFLYHQYINAPDSIFEKVYKLEPGSILKFKGGEIAIWKYWSIREVYAKKKALGAASYEEAKKELKDILKTAIKERMIADVPLGAFLSGGYDSSLVTAIAQEISDAPVKTFSIGFHEERYNEAKYAKQVAEYLGTRHTELYIGETEMFELVDSIPQFYDEPFADSSQIPSMLVSELAKKQVTVALSGDGGDEFFCGYNIYENVEKAQKLDRIGAVVYGVCNFPFARKADIFSKLPFRVKVIAGNRDPRCKTQISTDNYINVIKGLLGETGLPYRYPIEDQYCEKNWQERRMLLDMDTYLPGDILCKVDRASMKYSLETRCPILDTSVMEYAYRLPHAYKYKNGVKKRILKDIAYDYIPRELLDRPKVGFSVPLDKWLRGPLKENLLDVSSRDFLKKQGVFQAEAVVNFVREYLEKGDGGPATGKNYSRFVWSYYIFQKWYQYYMS